MADDSKNATARFVGGAPGVSNSEVGQGLFLRTSTLEVAAAASAASTYVMARVPTNARIAGLSKIYFDDLASTGSPTLDIGFKAVDANFTTDVDALNDGIDVAAAASSAAVVKDIANYGKQVWEILGLSSNPGGFADVTITILDAATNTGGTLTMELVYSVG